MKLKKSTIAAFIAPAAIIFLLVYLYPIIRTFLMSFFQIDYVTARISEWNFTGIENYVKLANTNLFLTSMWNIFRIWLVGGLIVMGLALLFAVILNSGIRGKRFFQTIIYMPNIISAVALATMWLQYVYNPQFGLLTNFFEGLGLDALANIKWTSPDMKFWAMLIAYCFGMVGYHMLIFNSGIEQISQEYYDAAHIDGAGKIKQFRFVTWPLIQGVLKTNITMWTITSAAFFVWSQLFSTVTADTGTITPTVYMYLQIFGAGSAISERNAGLGAAVGVILSLTVVLIFAIVNKVIKSDDLEY